MIHKIVILGGGTAGLLSGLTIKRLNPDLDIQLVRSIKLGHIMVGEGTVGSTPKFLHSTLGFDKSEFYEMVKPTWKLGVRFLWGKRPYFDYTFTNPLSAQPSIKTTQPLGYFSEFEDVAEDWCLASALMTQNKVFVKNKDGLLDTSINQHAYHFENSAFVQYLEIQCDRYDIDLIDDEMLFAKQNELGIDSLHCVSGRTLSADMYIDASGFRGKLIQQVLDQPYKTMGDSLFCDRAVVGGWPRGEREPIKPYTTAETMNAGWCWQIEHRKWINRGYVYCSAFVTDEQAEQEFRAKNPSVTETRVIPFSSQCISQSWYKNVVAIGNANGFLEPLEATNIQVIANFSLKLAQSLQTDRVVTTASRDNFNRYTEQSWNCVRDFLALHYKYNDRVSSSFWEMARRDTPLGNIVDFVNNYCQTGPNILASEGLLASGDLFGTEGYLSMLIGMKVPFSSAREVSSKEVDYVRLLRKRYQYQATHLGMSSEQVLRSIDTELWP